MYIYILCAIQHDSLGHPLVDGETEGADMYIYNMFKTIILHFIPGSIGLIIYF